MEYSGEILSIIYQNEINSYTIAEMYIDELEKTETVVRLFTIYFRRR